VITEDENKPKAREQLPEAINPVAIWFVTYQPVGRVSGNGYSRSSKQFANERDAKAFAKDRLTEGSEITAGTLNPHSPKRFIGSARILDWLND
jgi:hypothetical protein